MRGMRLREVDILAFLTSLILWEAKQMWEGLLITRTIFIIFHCSEDWSFKISMSAHESSCIQLLSPRNRRRQSDYLFLPLRHTLSSPFSQDNRQPWRPPPKANLTGPFGPWTHLPQFTYWNDFVVPWGCFVLHLSEIGTSLRSGLLTYVYIFSVVTCLSSSPFHFLNIIPIYSSRQLLSLNNCFSNSNNLSKQRDWVNSNRVESSSSLMARKSMEKSFCDSPSHTEWGPEASVTKDLSSSLCLPLWRYCL